jgi:hypothetical protein
LSILAGIAVVAVVVIFHRANERRFSALSREMRAVAEQSRQSGASQASRPVHVLAASHGMPPTPQATASPEEPAASDADDPANQPRGQNITEEEQAAYVGMVFSDETSDSAWALQAERAIGGSLRSLAESSTLDSVECRRTLCKASLRHGDQAKFSGFLDRVVEKANELWTGPILSHREAVGADGVIENTIYFAKPGHSIPLMEE